MLKKKKKALEIISPFCTHFYNAKKHLKSVKT